MKKSKVILASGAIFCVALNLTACVYGAPPDYNETSTQATEVQETNEETEESVESEES